MANTPSTFISFATSWGTRFGGINSFNYDLLGAFATLCCRQVETVCVVLWASDGDFADAAKKQVRLISLGLQGERSFSPALEPRVWDSLITQNVCLGQDTVWLGHDRITGEIALAAAKARTGRSALIHHMSYTHYEAFAENSVDARVKEDQQRALFQSADIVMAVGPLLKKALIDIRDDTQVTMLVPGLPEIEVKGVAPQSFNGILSGRLSVDARKIKQAHLGVAAFSKAIRDADATPHLANVFLAKNQPGLLLRGVDFEKNEEVQIADAELELRCFAEHHAERAYNLKALPFTTDRSALFNDIRNASIAMMPSWHEGFGLVAWEAIAAGVPVVLSDKSGAYMMLEEWQEGLYKGHVTSIDVRGSNVDPFYKEQDVERLVTALNVVGNDPSKRRQAASLREALAAEFTWTQCARECVKALGWKITEVDNRPVPVEAASPPNVQRFDWLSSPGLSLGHSDSQLLRAEAAVVPFDKDREPFLNVQLAWAYNQTHPLAIRLLTGPGGVGKTRLALELCVRLRECGWLSGLLASECAPADMSRLVGQLRSSNQPSIIVIDYAETRQETLIALIRALKRNACMFPIRILLLARDGGEWWRGLPEHDNECAGILGGLETSGPYELPMLHEAIGSRLRAYQDASIAFAKHLKISVADNQPNLEADHFDRPLFIQMAALMTLRGESAESAEGLPRALLNHESEYWRRTLAAHGLGDEQSLRQATILMTLSTLISGIPTSRVLDEILDLRTEERVGFKNLFNLLTPLYPDRQGLQPLRPDLVGEALVAKALLEYGTAVFERVLSEGNSHQKRSALTVTSRMLRYREDLVSIVSDVLDRQFLGTMDEWIAVCLETRSPMPGILEAIFSQMNPKRKLQVAGALKNKLRVEMIALLGLRQQVGEVLVEYYESKGDKAGRKHEVDQSAALKWHSETLRYIGQSVSAKHALEMALSISRIIAERDSKHVPILINILCDISQHRSEFGMVENAMAAIEEALSRIRQLRNLTAQQRAKVLGIYALRLDECGRNEEAVEFGKQSLDLHRGVSQANLPIYQGNLGIAYSRYSIFLSHNGREDEALQAAQECLELRRKLSEHRGFKDHHDLAVALGNYANRLSAQGNLIEAIENIKEAELIATRLAETKPGRFAFDLATIQYNYSLILGDEGDLESAIALGESASAIYQGLNEVHLLYKFGVDREKCRLLLATWRWLALGVNPEEEASKLLNTQMHPEGAGVEFQRRWLLAYANPSPERLVQALEQWERLNRAEQQGWRAGYFLVSILADKVLGPEAVSGDWHEQFRLYMIKRKGHLPFWIKEMANRLGCEIQQFGIKT